LEKVSHTKKIQKFVFELTMTISGRKFVAVTEDIKDKIIGIDFMHAHKMNYDATFKQITFARMLTNALYTIKETAIPARLSINANYLLVETSPLLYQPCPNSCPSYPKAPPP
jgi:hypothetical protein